MHFGNGTQACFYQRDDVLTISIHQQAGYLQVRGEADELGEGAELNALVRVALKRTAG